MQVISAFQLGGAEEVAINLAIGLAARGHQSIVVAIGRQMQIDPVGAEQKDRLADKGVEFIELGGPNPRINQLTTPWRLLGEIRRWKPDIVHSHTDIPDAAVSTARRFARFRVARTIHNSVLWPTHRVFGWFVERGFRDDLVMAVCGDAMAAYEKLRLHYRLPISATASVIENGVSDGTGGESLSREQLVSALSADPNKALFGMAGRLDHQKGIDVLIEMLAGLSQEYRDRIEIHSFGDGSKRSAYAAAVAERDLPITLHPPKARVSQWFTGFDAILMPSRYEGLAIVAIEALIRGVPVIGTTATGLRQSMPPDWPLAAPAGDPNEFGALLRAFVDGRFDEQGLAKRAQEWARAHHGLEKMVASYEAAYERYLTEL